MRITEKEIESVLRQKGPQRYSYCIKRAADRRKLWGLYSEGWALAATDSGSEVFPIWPAREYAELSAQGPWQGYKPREIDLDEVFDSLIPSLKERKTLLGVFYTPTDKGVLPDLGQFECDLRTELARIE